MIYCKFTSRVPKGADYGYFATVVYKDKECTQELMHSVKQMKLMKNAQFINSVQSYGFALECIRAWQGKIKAMGESNIILMTYNSTLAKWINEPHKAGEYEKYLESINSLYRAGGKREIKLAVGLAYDEKNSASKYCTAAKVNSITKKNEVLEENKETPKFKSALDIINEEKVDGLNSEEW